jgi:hypothetical protein
MQCTKGQMNRQIYRNIDPLIAHLQQFEKRCWLLTKVYSQFFSKWKRGDAISDMREKVHTSGFAIQLGIPAANMLLRDEAITWNLTKNYPKTKK